MKESYNETSAIRSKLTLKYRILRVLLTSLSAYHGNHIVGQVQTKFIIYTNKLFISNPVPQSDFSVLYCEGWIVDDTLII